MKICPKYCPKCRKIYPPKTEYANCPEDGAWLEDLGSLINTSIAGKYVITQELGSGGFGTVYMGQHEELGSRVAIKILSPEFCENIRHIEKFKRESYTLARLDHPGVVKVIDCGLSPRPFIVMEFAYGKPLSVLLKERSRLSEMSVFYLFKKLVETLSYAHGLGVVHRDIKPVNIIANSLDTDNPEIKLLDFGVAKLLDQDLIIAQTGEALGTPQYMSPEQFTQDDLITAKADIYALGCVLFECLAGRHPFKARNYIEWSSVHRLVGAMFTDDDSSKFSKLGKEMANMILSCLAKNPDSRPTAEELLVQLRRISPASTAQGSNEPIAEKILELLKAKPKIAIAAGVFLLVICISSGFAFMGTKKVEATKKVMARVDESKTDLITSLGSTSKIQKIEHDRMAVKALAIDATVFSPPQAHSIVLVLQSERNATDSMDVVFENWAQHGSIVVAAEMNTKNISAEKLAALAKTLVKQSSKRNDFSSEPGSGFILASNGLGLEETIAAGKILAQGDSNSILELAGLLVIDPTVESKSRLSMKELHTTEFPIFYVLDSQLEGKLRAATARQCQKAFLYAAGKQMFYNSSRVSLIANPAYTDQQVLRALISGYLDAHLQRDKGKETYLYSHKSETAVSSSGELRFR